MWKKQDKNSFTRTISELLKLPADVACGDTRISIIGNNRVIMENYRSILVYTETLIKIQARNQTVIVEGKRLRIRYYDQDEMEIIGRISNIMFD